MPGLSDLAGLFAPAADETTIALAVSGGGDSLALMLLVARWVAEVGRRPAVVVYSVDHGLRPEAADEVNFVLAEAERLGFAGRGFRWEEPKPAAGVQAAARAARYGMMQGAMAEDGAGLLLTAHHLRDQAETVLMRLAHGSGPEGLRGMSEMSTVEGARVFRPLLGIHPDELAAVVAAAGLTPVTDPSNADDHYERVRWRKALPLLEDLGFTTERLGTLARRMGEISDAIAAVADDAEEGIVTTTADETRLELGGFRALPPAVAAQVLVRALLVHSTLRRAPSLVGVEAVRDALLQGETGGRTLHGCVLNVTGTAIIVRAEKPRRASLKALHGLTTN